ncbi:phospholipid carrier-dependent glycosyltransferase [Candidatus Peregrinibacteria bacterium]|nr:phospholipid carrier-dependent glycosyltransferase [Candidatus Peregrinibacteria bacterium]MBI3816340.1 phospholipid carrier-dependent glycosyltransferase [Candidatus Peregrinibacteria bacterium]
MSAQKSSLWTMHTFLFLGFVILLSYLTYFHHYWEPQAVFWDENYHVASAQKYLNGVYFMEQHPPLGKLLIAAGEKILHPNARADQYIGTDYATNFPTDFSFAGYRFFSAFLGWWTASLLFLIFLLITRNPLLSSFLSFFYIFDNALIVHIRGAMLEGPLEFFCTAMILVFLFLLEYRERQRLFFLWSVLFGVVFALIMTTKILGLIFILLVPSILWQLLPNWRKIGRFLLCFALGFLVVYITVWQIHFALGKKIVSSLPDNGYYQASPEYKQILATGRSSSLLAFPIMLRDSYGYIAHYNRGTPRLDLCKPDENGSPFFDWPIGARAINYRWETPDGNTYRYLYLQSNPVVWLTTFAAVILAICLLVGSFLAPPRPPLTHRFLLLVFTGLYVSFFVAISRITRVLYLYHYFIPLLLGFVIAAIVLMEVKKVGRWNITEHAQTFGLLVLAGLIFVSFQFYRPLTYYEPLTDAQFARRAILPVWELSSVHGTRTNALAVAKTCGN